MESVDGSLDPVSTTASAPRRPRVPAVLTFLSLVLVGVGVILVFQVETATSLWVMALLGLAASVSAIVLEHERRCILGMALAIAAVLVDSLLVMAAAFFGALKAFLDTNPLWFH